MLKWSEKKRKKLVLCFLFNYRNTLEGGGTLTSLAPKDPKIKNSS
jgi:hypothetical protein